MFGFIYGGSTLLQGGTSVEIIVPTINEHDNVGPLVERLADAKQGIPGSVVVRFVDDSPTPDAMMAAVQDAASLYGTSTLRLLLDYRPVGEQVGGLSGSVVHGITRTRADIVVVMDGDLQHPPELLPDVIRAAATADAVVASRHMRGGSSGGLDGPLRLLVSRTSTLLARLLFPSALRGVTDPMTGFFAIKRENLKLERLKPTGFKILLELLGTHPQWRVQQVPLQFGERKHGVSKADLRQGLRFLRQICDLRLRSLRRA